MQGETESVITQRFDTSAAPRSKAVDVLMRELRHFGTVFLYLALVFGVFALHAFVVLANNGMSYQFYGASLINAAILAKILHLAEAFHFGDKFTDKPLAYPILYKSVASDCCSLPLMSSRKSESASFAARASPRPGPISAAERSPVSPRLRLSYASR